MRLNVFIYTTPMHCVRSSVRTRRCLPRNHPQMPSVQTPVPQHCLASQLCSYCETWPANTDVTLRVPLPLMVTFTYAPASDITHSPQRRYQDSHDFFLMNQRFPCPNCPNTVCQTPDLSPKYIFNSLVVMQLFFGCPTTQHPSTLLSWVSPHMCSCDSWGGREGIYLLLLLVLTSPPATERMEIAHHMLMLPYSQPSKCITPITSAAVSLGEEGTRTDLYRDWPALPCQNNVPGVTKSELGWGSRHEKSGPSLVRAFHAGSHTPQVHIAQIPGASYIKKK